MNDLKTIQTVHKGADQQPAYVQLANIIKQKIASGEYPPGSKIPAEAAIGRLYGISTMTVRQAIGLVADQGLLRRIQGSGTYVLSPAWTRANFGIDGLLERLDDKKNISIVIIKAGIIEAMPEIANKLAIPNGSRVLNLDRLVSHKDQPFLLNKAFLRFDPLAPIVEAELEISSLSGLFSGEGSQVIKKAVLNVEPAAIEADEGRHFKDLADKLAYKICYTFFDFKDLPVGTGWFIAPKQYMTLSTQIGLWD